MYSRLHENFNKYIHDVELSPVHKDPEHQPPRYYLPVIPLLLVNGASGIATGFATNILPRSEEDIKTAMLEYINDGKIKTDIAISFPEFAGSTTREGTSAKYICSGMHSKPSKTALSITEVPYGVDHKSYKMILDKLEDNDDIVGYDDLTRESFEFNVKLKLNTSAGWDDEKIASAFKLEKPYTENITVIDENGKLKKYENANDLIIDFVNFRMNILKQRIERKIETHGENLRWLEVKIQFILAVLDGSIQFKDMKRSEVETQILEHTNAIDDDLNRLLSLNMLSMTLENVNAAKDEIKQCRKEIKYWKGTNPKEQFINDIEIL